jgi:hypothetical protein
MPTQHLLSCLRSGALRCPRTNVDDDEALDFDWLNRLLGLREDLSLAEAAWPAASERIQGTRDDHPYEGWTDALTAHEDAMRLLRALLDDLAEAVGATRGMKWCGAAPYLAGVLGYHLAGVDLAALRRAVRHEGRRAQAAAGKVSVPELLSAPDLARHLGRSVDGVEGRLRPR